MKISIFPAAKPHPASKEEKDIESFKVSFPHLPETKSIRNEEELIALITSYAWSPFVFSGKRHSENFVSCDFLTYDIDEGLTIDGADLLLQKSGYCYLILPSPSHSETNHRFRVLLPLAYSIRDEETYAESWKVGANILGVVDEQCKDLARYFFGSRQNDGYWQEGVLFEPIKTEKFFSSEFRPSQTLLINVSEDISNIVEQIYGEKRAKIPEAVDFFLKNAHTAIPGNWICSLNSFVFSLSLSNVDDCAIMELCEQLAPEALDKRDISQIEKAIKDGKKARETL